MKKLFVFGNGLDLHYKLNTKPEDFLHFLTKEKVCNSFSNAADIYESYNVLWSDFEIDIAKLNLERIEEDQLGFPDYTSDRESDRDDCILNMKIYLDSIREATFNALKKMVDNANKDLKNKMKDYEFPFEKGDSIISFNYTSTIEELYYLPGSIEILHIHGCLEEDEELIMGYKDENTNYNYQKYSNEEDGDYYLEKQAELIYDFYKNFKKELQIDKLKDFLCNKEDIEEVYVFGHSFGSVDISYFEMINTVLNVKRWMVYYHGEDDDALTNCKMLSFYNNIIFLEW